MIVGAGKDGPGRLELQVPSLKFRMASIKGDR